jgi:hypothetical protein
VHNKTACQVFKLLSAHPAATELSLCAAVIAPVFADRLLSAVATVTFTPLCCTSWVCC